MSKVEIHELKAPRVSLGEGPHWVERDQALVYVDLQTGTLHRHFTRSQRNQSLQLEDVGTGGTVGFVVPVAGRQDEFVVGIGRTLASVKWSPEEGDEGAKKPRPLAEVDGEGPSTRFNDAKCDPSGRLWAGTMGTSNDVLINEDREGTLYRFDSSSKPTAAVEKVCISNGLGWSPDRRTFFYVDSCERTVDAFDYDDVTGHISNRRVAFDYAAAGEEAQVLPDGMAIDAEGNLWVACYLGSKVLCISPRSGHVIRAVELPVGMMTSCCFGGPDYSTLFVTSAMKNAEALGRWPQAGRTFAVTGLGVKGLPAAEVELE